MTVAVIDMDVSNVGSVANMLRRIGADAEVTTDHGALRRADRIILPGVGAYDVAARQLRASGIDDELRRAADSGVPVLGVCLGMQLLADGSEEGSEPGLGLIAGVARRLPDEVSGARYPVPHMGWNTVTMADDTSLGLLGEDERRYYFVHSYAVQCNDPGDAVGTTVYGEGFTSVIERDNVAGVQFHPEKSHRHGMALLAAWVGI